MVIQLDKPLEHAIQPLECGVGIGFMLASLVEITQLGLLVGLMVDVSFGVYLMQKWCIQDNHSHLDKSLGVQNFTWIMKASIPQTFFAVKVA